jgi:hypothetical protein
MEPEHTPGDSRNRGKKNLMSRIKFLVREPLVHFLVIGVVLFVTFDLRQGDSGETENLILISSGQIEQFSAQFERTWLRSPTDAELAGLVEGYIRNEVYYREARAMGLDENDGIVRQRMRLKLEFLLEDLSVEAPPDDEQLAEFMRRHPDRFQIEPRISFTQIYLNPDKRQDITADAAETLARLAGGGAPEVEGDRLMVDQTQTLASKYKITSVFGASFAEQLVALEPNGWIGPIFSGYGAHLVKVTEKQAGRFPELSEIRDEVARDYMVERRQELKDLTYARFREGYEVVVEAADVAADQSIK